jgi:transposase
MRGHPLAVTEQDRATLVSWSRATTMEQRLAWRARVILALATGKAAGAVATAFHTRPSTVSKWKSRYQAQGLAGLQDAARPGKPVVYGAPTESRILAKLDEAPPPGYARWNGRLLAKALGTVNRHHIWRVLRAHGISLERRRSWCISTDPTFAQKAADIVGLYLHPPAHALVLCVDEKPAIQALERAQGWLKLPTGKALTGFNHEYTRHGTTTLFAALEVATGLVQAGHYRRRRRVEFLDFMNRVVAAYPGKDLHVIVDNLNTHKPKQDRWLARHPQVHFHFTPTHASWLNQVEVWFSILMRAALQGASFHSPQEVRDRIDAFVAAYNKTAHPFEWTKQVVFAKHPKAKYAN